MNPTLRALYARGLPGIVLSFLLAACGTTPLDRGTVASPWPSSHVAAVAPQSGDDAPETVVRTGDNVRLHKGTGPLIKAPRAAAQATSPANISLNFEGADVREIAKTVLAEILKESYIVDPKAQGSITFRTTRPLSREALLPTLETILKLNGIVMVKENGIFKIMPAAGVKGSLSPQLAGNVAGFTMQVIPLQFVGAREMAKILEGVAADPSMVKTDELRNLLILAGTQNEIRHMLDTVDMFDVDWMSGMSVGLFVLQSADVKTVDQDLAKVFGDKNGPNPLAGVVKLIPIERLNAFVIITPQPKYLDQAKVWLERLDRVGGTGGSRLFVYHVQNGRAEHLANLLNQTFGSQGAATQSPAKKAATVAPGLSGAEIGGLSNKPAASMGLGTTALTKPKAAEAAPVAGATLTIADESGGAGEQVRVVADAENNALLILANGGGYEKIEAALRKLDAAPRQVLIEVTIAEVTLKDELRYGVEWLFTNGARRSGKLDLGTAGLAALTPGFSYAITDVAGTTIKSVLNTLATDNNLNILSSPHIMVADNQTAKIQVGDSVPTAGPQSVSGTGVVVSSVQYLDTGVILSVTPRINAGGLVNLDIIQEVSTASATTTSGLNSPTISKRSAQTTMNVQSGETMVLGGLMSERSFNESAGLPVLSTIPILGGLFGSQSRDRTRTELIVLITPRVANNVNQAKELSDELRRKMGEVKDLLDCGTRNVFGYGTRGGLWCLQPGRWDGATDTHAPSAGTVSPAPIPPARDSGVSATPMQPVRHSAAVQATPSPAPAASTPAAPAATGAAAPPAAQSPTTPVNVFGPVVAPGAPVPAAPAAVDEPAPKARTLKVEPLAPDTANRIPSPVRIAPRAAPPAKPLVRRGIALPWPGKPASGASTAPQEGATAKASDAPAAPSAPAASGDTPAKSAP